MKKCIKTLVLPCKAMGFLNVTKIKVSTKKDLDFPIFTKLLTFGRVLETDFKSN